MDPLYLLDLSVKLGASTPLHQQLLASPHQLLPEICPKEGKEGKDSETKSG